MTRIKNFFCITMSACSVCVALAGGAYGASDGCDKDANDRIAAELALCSVHAYNIGSTTNPTGADKQLMKEIVALKTTVIAQQMNKQYEYMDAMIRRFRTQLEKAVLTTKLQKAGAATDADASSDDRDYGSSVDTTSRRDRVTNVHIDGAKNCEQELDLLDMLNCLGDNYSTISSATNAGQKVTSEARRQLATDFKLLAHEASLLDENQVQPRRSNKYNDKCEDANNMSQRQTFQDCLSAHSKNIRTARTEYNRKNQQQNKPNN